MIKSIISLYIIIPILALSANFIQGSEVRQFGRAFNLLLMLLLSFLPAICLLSYETQYAFTIGGWKQGFGITISLDIQALLFLGILYFVNFFILLYSLQDTRVKTSAKKFFMGYWLLVLGMTGAIVTRDLFNLYVWSEVMLVSVFILLSSGHQEDSSMQINYATFNIIGTLCLLVAIALLYRATGSLNYYDIGARMYNIRESVPIVGFGLMLFGLGIKSGLFPLYFWLPVSYPKTSPSSTALLSSIVTKTTLMVILRLVWIILPNQIEAIGKFMLIVAGCTMVFGVFGAIIQSKIREILSFHIISQIGYIVLGIFIESRLAVVAAIYFIIHNVLVKTNLVLISGISEKIYGTGSLSEIGGRMLRDNTLVAVLFILSALSLAGFPPLSGFWAKFYIIYAAVEANHMILALVAVGVSFLTLFSMLKIWRKGYCEEREPDRLSAKTRVPKAQLFSVIVLTLGMLSIGCFPELIIHMLNKSAAELSIMHGSVIDAY